MSSSVVAEEIRSLASQLLESTVSADIESLEHVQLSEIFLKVDAAHQRLKKLKSKYRKPDIDEPKAKKLKKSEDAQQGPNPELLKMMIAEQTCINFLTASLYHSRTEMLQNNFVLDDPFIKVESLSSSSARFVFKNVNVSCMSNEELVQVIQDDSLERFESVVVRYGLTRAKIQGQALCQLMQSAKLFKYVDLKAHFGLTPSIKWISTRCQLAELFYKFPGLERISRSFTEVRDHLPVIEKAMSSIKEKYPVFYDALVKNAELIELNPVSDDIYLERPASPDSFSSQSVSSELNNLSI